MRSFRWLAMLGWFCLAVGHCLAQEKRPNILLFITDDESWLERSAYGWAKIPTPNFDRIAKRGALFNNAYTSAPSCAPSRAALLAGRNFWELEQGAFIQAWLPEKFPVFPHLLAAGGYHTGRIGKGWGPGVHPAGGHSPGVAGKIYNSAKLAKPEKAMTVIDYPENLEALLADRKDGQPFFCWMGVQEPHAPWAPGNHLKLKERYGLTPDQLPVPEFLDDNGKTRLTRANMLYEICRADEMLGEVLAVLEKKNELENTLIIVTSDNGTGCPLSKAGPYDWGTHVPFAVMWPGKIQPASRVSAFQEPMKKSIIPTALLLAATLMPAYSESGIGWVSYPGGKGPGEGKHVVLLAGDEEYRSEEALPMLAKILSKHHGFKCTVLFSTLPDGTIDPNKADSLGNPATLDSADVIVTSLRFRKWPDDAMKHFDDAIKRGVPVVGLRTSTHSFQLPGDSKFKEYNSFGKKVLGEQWVSHWGDHKVEATLGLVEKGAEKNPVLNGVEKVFADSDVYEAYPPADATILMRGQVLKGMEPTSIPSSRHKTRSSDKVKQDINTPMMPVAWTREVKNDGGKTNRILTTTMGAATDLKDESLRRLVVNGVFWGAGLAIPAMADVSIVGTYQPSKYEFNGFRKGTKAADYE
ncbi:MAG: hypothetical protein EOP88_24215 [Verrucomicrobiaceae bacterium]|nr:MAG: hypothetical protein EOP88_24215 [Verrucomicrobiaceae bacterium]